MTNEDIVGIIDYLNIHRDVCFKQIENCNKKYIAEYSGNILLENCDKIEMIISFSTDFPLTLPDIFVADNNKFRAHVGTEGKICLFDSSAILIKQAMADQLVLDCFDQAVKILNIQPGSKTYNNEVCREFDSYWLSIRNKMAYSCLDTKDIKYAEIPIVISHGTSIIGNTKDEAEVILRNNFGLAPDKNDFERTCLVIKIRAGSSMIPLAKQFKWSVVRRYIVENTSSSVRRQFKKFLDKKVKHYMRYIILAYPAEEGDILFGFRIEFNNSRYLKIGCNQMCRVENVFVERIDFEYLTMRGGAMSELKEKRVLLLGCGSIGGFIANNLCQAGIMNIDILDNDLFQPENVHRHWLGFDAISPKKYGYKADLVKEKLEAMYPYADIDPLNYTDRSAQKFISDEKRLGQYDLIISALGEPTINLEINRILNDNNIETPFVCCFNEPYGVGGHVISINIDKKSCLQCLYTDVISSDLVQFRGSFVAPEQNFKKNLSGCSGAFVPYSCLDSQQTALLAARQSIGILNGTYTNNSVSSWIGESEELLGQGFYLSEWYLANINNRNITIEAITNQNCSICNRRDKE
ncbi:ThiF family adenylyltransferase [Eubacteriaceae bacterium ES3]|nr:ThiF family adenylyltransferase [Eubacteriaceae bacterium ES3]